jgi:hypothetical protein
MTQEEPLFPLVIITMANSSFVQGVFKPYCYPRPTTPTKVKQQRPKKCLCASASDFLPSGRGNSIDGFKLTFSQT